MKQEKALHLMKAGKNVFLTGSAGTGKTYVLNQYIRYLRERKVNVAVTASTGIAATHLNGQTIHSWSGMGVRSRMTTSQIMGLADKAHVTKRLEGVQVLIIDEVSMLHKDQLDLVSLILQKFKLSAKPFGGIQVVLSGDFFQLPPVTKNAQSSRQKFAFMSRAWLDAGLHVCYLTEQHRQSDHLLNQILNEMRFGEIKKESIQALLNTKDNALGDEPTELYTHNVSVNAVNNKLLDAVDGDVHTFNGEISGNFKLGEMLTKSVLAPRHLKLKVGAKVMFVKNDPDGFYSNGSIGVVKKFIEDDGREIPVVKLTSGVEVVAYPQKWSMNDDKDKAIVSFEQIPLRLGWAVTVHKSQGMTLDEARMDLSKTFEKGQGYVALSRVKRLEGLQLLGLNQTALQLDSLAMRADERFRELSTLVDEKFENNQLREEFIPFLNLVGGITDTRQIRKNRKRKAEKKKKKPTIEITRDLLKEGLTINEIAEEREITMNTVIGHLQKLKDQYPELDLSSVKPIQTVLDEIRTVYYDLVEDGNKKHFTDAGQIRIKVIQDRLHGLYGYDDIRTALLFIEEKVPEGE